MQFGSDTDFVGSCCGRTRTRRERARHQLLEDYALFIESSPDHVINSVLKKLWLDQDYRKWRD